mmetsp:Transcript_28806/g.68886  ORF Transcript_28806/g.68886 Transcript_28806/m.68886 type:complete len:236 (-) Transcript_28806:1519-2226(-)
MHRVRAEAALEVRHVRLDQRRVREPRQLHGFHVLVHRTDSPAFRAAGVVSVAGPDHAHLAEARRHVVDAFAVSEVVAGLRLRLVTDLSLHILAALEVDQAEIHEVQDLVARASLGPVPHLRHCALEELTGLKHSRGKNTHVRVVELSAKHQSSAGLHGTESVPHLVLLNAVHVQRARLGGTVMHKRHVTPRRALPTHFRLTAHGTMHASIALPCGSVACRHEELIVGSRASTASS